MRPPELRLAAVAIAVRVVAAGALVWATLPGPAASGCTQLPPGPTPLGSSWAIGTPTARDLGSFHWYNASVISAGGGLRLDNFNFSFQQPGGGDVSPGSAWNMTVLGISGNSIGAYTLTGVEAGTWGFGGSTAFGSEETFSLLTTPDSLSGDTWVFQATAPATLGCVVPGSVSVSIP